jgi:LmbE family N-acetylglucosaminyl deacetylase
MTRHAWRFATAVAMVVTACGGGVGDSAMGLGTDAGAVAADATVAPPAGVLAAMAPIRRVLWVGAHPDDEGYASPLFYDLCVRRGATCSFLVITDGGKGNCVLGDGACGVKDTGGAPAGSVGAFRLAEVARSVAYLHGTLIALALEDTASATVLGDGQNWNQRLSGVPNDTSLDLITGKIAAAIQHSQADVIVTFDPRHGVYCQPDHRAAGALTLRAASQLGFDMTRVLMLETTEFYADAHGQPAARAWVASDPALLHYDAAAAGTWAAHPAVWGFHRSQYTAATVAALAGFPVAAQDVPLLTAAQGAMPGPLAAAYDAVCATEDAWWDGHGVCPRADGTTGPCW